MAPREIPPFNTRSPQMWEAISQAVDFTGKAVVDLGCGYGDFLWRCFLAGAKSVMGIDRDPTIVKTVRFRLDRAGYAITPVTVLIGNLDDWGAEGLFPFADVALCFSVLPYLKDAESFLRVMSGSYHTSLIECQYWGDGPGPSHIKNDMDMKAWLENWWNDVEPIGHTRIADRNAIRTIWRCQ